MTQTLNQDCPLPEGHSQGQRRSSMRRTLQLLVSNHSHTTHQLQPTLQPQLQLRLYLQPRLRETTTEGARQA